MQGKKDTDILITGIFMNHQNNASSLVALSVRDQAGALSLFNGLDTSQQRGLVHEACPEDKKELLFLAKDLSSLLDALPGRDVLLALAAATASEFDTLVERIGPEHLNFMLAMGCWRQGAIDDGRFLHWLEVLNTCDEAVAAKAVSNIEADFLAAALRPHFDVEGVFDEDNPDSRGEAEAFSFTPDYCRFDNDIVEDFMTRLFETDRTLFALVCHKRVYENPDEILESARLAYSLRLKKEGLPTYEEAVEVYEKGWDILQKADMVKKSSGKTVVSHGGTDLFLARVMDRIHRSGKGGPFLAHDFSGLLQKISIADGGEMDTIGRQRTVKKAELYASLGLENASKGDVGKGAELLLTNGITGFFKAGHDMISGLRERANQIVKYSGDGELDKIGMKERAVLENAALEMPRIMAENGKSRMLRTEKEYDLLMKAVETIGDTFSS